MNRKLYLFVILSSFNVGTYAAPIEHLKTNVQYMVDTIYRIGCKKFDSIHVFYAFINMCFVFVSIWLAEGRCPSGRIESIRLLHNGNMYIKVDSLNKENYTNVKHLFEPLMWAFYLDARIQLNTNTCNSSDHGFGSFTILSFNKTTYDMLSSRTKINFVPLEELPKSWYFSIDLIIISMFSSPFYHLKLL